MITVQELAKRFKQQVAISEDALIKPNFTIPSKDWDVLCSKFTTGESYMFLSSKLGILDIWRNNLMWQLSKRSLPITVLQNQNKTERDFLGLLSLEAQIPKYRLKPLLLSREERALLPEYIAVLEHYCLSWQDNMSADTQNPSIVFLNATLDQLSSPSFLQRAKERGNIVLGFVENEIDLQNLLTEITDKGFCVGFLEVDDLQSEPNHAIFSLSLYNKTLEEKIFFDFDFHTGLLTKVEKM